MADEPNSFRILDDGSALDMPEIGATERMICRYLKDRKGWKFNISDMVFDLDIGLSDAIDALFVLEHLGIIKWRR